MIDVFSNTPEINRVAFWFRECCLTNDDCRSIRLPRILLMRLTRKLRMAKVPTEGSCRHAIYESRQPDSSDSETERFLAEIKNSLPQKKNRFMNQL